jgi:phosphate-selective porin OprO/OprP
VREEVRPSAAGSSNSSTTLPIPRASARNKLDHLINFKSTELNKFLKCCVFVVLTGTSFISAHAFTIGTKGGPKLKTEDGNFEIGINGRAHLDVHSFNQDRANAVLQPFGSQLSSDHERSGFNWRRTYLTLTGRIYRLNFKFENDFAAGDFPGSIRETWLSTNLGPGLITVGQFKPYRGMEELTSSNEITLMERPSTSSTGIYNGTAILDGGGLSSHHWRPVRLWCGCDEPESCGILH